MRFYALNIAMQDGGGGRRDGVAVMLLRLKSYECRYLAALLSSSETNETNPTSICVLRRTARAHCKLEFVQILSLIFPSDFNIYCNL